MESDMERQNLERHSSEGHTLEHQHMERRHFLKIAFGFAAGAVVLASAAKVAKAAPLAPQSLPPADADREPQAALATQDDLDQARVEQVRWHRHGHWHHRRRWHWHRRRHWHRRHRRNRWHW